MQSDCVKLQGVARGGLFLLLAPNCHPQACYSYTSILAPNCHPQVWPSTQQSLGLLGRLSAEDVQDDFRCEVCVQAKLARMPLPKQSSSRVEAPLDLIHSDVCGPMEVQVLGGKRYFVTFMDNATRYTTVYCLAHKSDVFAVFKAAAETFHERRIKVLRSDNGGEYCGAAFKAFLAENGVQHEKTVPYTPEQNGSAERMNRTLIEAVRCSLLSSGLPKSFWAEALLHAVHTQNRALTCALPDKTPYEAWFGHKPDARSLRAFGTKAFVRLEHHQRHKLDAVAQACVFLGYTDGVKGYRLYDPETRRLVTSHSVAFREDETMPVQWPKQRVQAEEGKGEQIVLLVFPPVNVGDNSEAPGRSGPAEVVPEVERNAVQLTEQPE